MFRGKLYLQAVSLRECKGKSCWINKILSPSPCFNILKLSRLVVFNQPIWKTCESQIGFHFAKVRGEHETYLKPPTRSWVSHRYGLVPEEFPEWTTWSNPDRDHYDSLNMTMIAGGCSPIISCWMHLQVLEKHMAKGNFHCNTVYNCLNFKLLSTTINK